MQVFSVDAKEEKLWGGEILTKKKDFIFAPVVARLCSLLGFPLVL